MKFTGHATSGTVLNSVTKLAVATYGVAAISSASSAALSLTDGTPPTLSTGVALFVMKPKLFNSPIRAFKRFQRKYT